MKAPASRKWRRKIGDLSADTMALHEAGAVRFKRRLVDGDRLEPSGSAPQEGVEGVDANFANWREFAQFASQSFLFLLAVMGCGFAYVVSLLQAWLVLRWLGAEGAYGSVRFLLMWGAAFIVIKLADEYFFQPAPAPIQRAPEQRPVPGLLDSNGAGPFGFQISGFQISNFPLRFADRRKGEPRSGYIRARG